MTTLHRGMCLRLCVAAHKRIIDTLCAPVCVGRRPPTTYIYIYIYIYWGHILLYYSTVWYSVDTDYNVIIVTRCQKDIWQNEQTTQAANINKWQRCGWPWLGSLCAPSETLIR